MDAPYPWIGARSARATGGGARDLPPLRPRERGASLALLALAACGLLRAALQARAPPPLEAHGRVFPVRIERLAGDEFRLLPGVGPVLAERLEAARQQAGGRLSGRDAERVPGVGPALRTRWGSR